MAIVECRLDYVIGLFDEATDFSWASAKGSHAVLLCRMEQDEIKSWLETDKIGRVRRAYAQKHSSSQSNCQRGQDNIHLTKILLVYTTTKVFAITYP